MLSVKAPERQRGRQSGDSERTVVQCIYFTLNERELDSDAVDRVGDSESVLVEVVRFHFADEQTELEVSAAD